MSDRLETLTDEQWALVHAARERVITETITPGPADRQRVESGIARCYAHLGLPAPRCVWVDGPLSAVIAANLLQAGDQLGGQLRHQLRDQLRDQLRGRLWDQLGGQLADQLGDQFWDQLGDQLWDQLWDQLGGQLRDQLRDQLGGQLGGQLADQLGGQLGGQLADQLGDQFWDQLRGRLWDQLGGQLRDQLWHQLRGRLWDQLADQLRDQLWDQLWDQLGGQLRDQLWHQLGDQFWDQFWDTSFNAWWLHWIYHWLTIDQFVADKIGDKRRAIANAWIDAHSASTWLPYRGIAIIADRHTRMTRDTEGRLHSDDGRPAWEWADGTAVHAHHGRRVEPWVVSGDTGPDQIARIAAETNIEVRRCAIERYGWAEYITDAGWTPVASDEYGKLYDVPGEDDQRVCVVTNGTIERDGTRRQYGLLCRAHHRTPLEAVAASYGVSAEQYGSLERRT